jgi:hypothetical protein
MMSTERVKERVEEEMESVYLLEGDGDDMVHLPIIVVHQSVVVNVVSVVDVHPTVTTIAATTAFCVRPLVVS